MKDLKAVVAIAGLLFLLVISPLNLFAQDFSLPSGDSIEAKENAAQLKELYEKLQIQHAERIIEESKNEFTTAVEGQASSSMLKSVTASGGVSANTEDSLALVDLYNSTDGANWYDNSNWLTDSVYKWYGITLNSEGRVMQIHLSGNNLSGQLPASIGKLTGLVYLYLHKNNLTGSIPVESGLLNSVKALYLTGNSLSGEIPGELGDLSELLWLGLGSNDLSGELPVELFDLSNLEFLDVSKNQLSGSIPSAISNLTNVKALYFEENSFSGSIPKEIGALSNLEELALYRNQLSGSIPVEIGNLTGLKQLYLHSNLLTGEIPGTFKDLTALEYLYLSSNDLTGSFPLWVCDLTSLKELFLADNNLTGQIPAEINNLKDLELFSLNYNQFSGAIPTEISELTKLKGLYLSDNLFEGEIPASLGMLTGLKELWLSTNHLTGAVPPELNQLTSVYRLLLSENNLSELPDLSALPLDSACYVQCNLFDFGDLETSKIDFTKISEYSYHPQIAVPLTMTESGRDVTFSVDVAGANNEYHWFREGIIISNETGTSLTVSKVYAGEYFCAITNNDFPDLVMVSEKKTLYAYSVEFSVTDGQDPIVNARVTLDGYGYKYTDATGIAVFSSVAPEDDMAYTVTASGFNDVSGTLSVVDGDVHVDVEMSVATGVDDVNDHGIDIYPNPTPGKLYIKSNEPVSKVEVYNITGELVFTKNDIGMNNVIDLTSFGKGLYMMVIQTADKVYTPKIIKR